MPLKLGAGKEIYQAWQSVAPVEASRWVGTVSAQKFLDEIGALKNAPHDR